MACILSVARFCAPSSELQIAQSWYDKTALDDLLGVSANRVNEDRLYRALDNLLPHKDALCKHLQDCYGELFGETSTFFPMISLRHILKGREKPTPRQREDIAETVGLTACRFVLAW